MRWQCWFVASVASLCLILGCASSPKGQAPKAAEGKEAGPDRPELSERRQEAMDLSVILPALAEPPVANAPVASAPRFPETRALPSSLATALPPIEPSPRMAAPAPAALDPSSIKLAEPPLPQPPAEQASAAKPAAKPAVAAPSAKAPAKSPAPAAKAPKATTSPKAEKKADAAAGAQVPSFASTPPSQSSVADPAADRQPDIAQRVAVELGSRVEIPLEGTGWTYLGEKDGKDGVLYESRRYEGSGLVFVLNPTKTGEYTLRFQRQDALRGKTNDELVGVSVSPKAAKQSSSAQAATAQAADVKGNVAAGAAASQTPASPLAGATQANGAQSASDPGPSFPPLPATVPPDSPEGLMLAAKNELTAGRVPGAIAILDRFLSLYPAGMDEAYYLYGLALEQNSPYRDIQKAYNYYKKVGDDYPESPLWDKARERASYIERHYFEIR